MTTNQPVCIGHRGAAGHTPENTLPSFEKAIRLGCPWVELDVHLVEDELLVIHDARVDRTTNGTGALAELELAYIRSLDAGGGAQVPTLAEVIDCIARRCSINIELKSDKTELKGDSVAVATGRLLNDYCARGWRQSDFLISSFNHQELARMDETYRRGVLFVDLVDDIWERTARLNAWSVHLAFGAVNQAIVDEAHARGYRILAYTLNDPADIKRLADYGVDGLVSDFPDRVPFLPKAKMGRKAFCFCDK